VEQSVRHTRPSGIHKTGRSAIHDFPVRPVFSLDITGATRSGIRSRQALKLGQSLRLLQYGMLRSSLEAYPALKRAHGEEGYKETLSGALFSTSRSSSFVRYLPIKWKRLMSLGVVEATRLSRLL